MNKPGSFKKQFEWRPFLRMIAASGTLAYLAAKAFGMYVMPRLI